ncbi:hypothetical protein IQ06DRAFT_351136 [Phaeosphaeriaceae sp. SRC1lsM3a]|nr:hypothetical protein IQ06DRAFT_351136 [Stagonospora sp. SRC1lsM3a]
MGAEGEERESQATVFSVERPIASFVLKLSYFESLSVLYTNNIISLKDSRGVLAIKSVPLARARLLPIRKLRNLDFSCGFLAKMYALKQLYVEIIVWDMSRREDTKAENLEHYGALAAILQPLNQVRAKTFKVGINVTVPGNVLVRLREKSVDLVVKRPYEDHAFAL